MTLEEYHQKIKDLEKEYDVKKRLIAREYAFSNSPYKKGDVIKDHNSKIRIEEIKFYFSTDRPSCVYIGPSLKKDGTPQLERKTKKPMRDTIYQSNIITDDTETTYN